MEQTITELVKRNHSLQKDKEEYIETLRATRTKIENTNEELKETEKVSDIIIPKEVRTRKKFYFPNFFLKTFFLGIFSLLVLYFLKLKKLLNQMKSILKENLFL